MISCSTGRTVTVLSNGPDPEQFTGVDFAVPTLGGIGPRFPVWQDAVDCARSAITRLEYPGQRVNEAAADYHSRRYLQEGNALVVYTRSFVDMRAIVAPDPSSRGTAATFSSSDGVICRWEVFWDGAVEMCPPQPPARLEVPVDELADVLGRSGYRTRPAPAGTVSAIIAALAEAGLTVVRQARSA